MGYRVTCLRDIYYNFKGSHEGAIWRLGVGVRGYIWRLHGVQGLGVMGYLRLV